MRGRVAMKPMTPGMVGRLATYRRVLDEFAAAGTANVHSRDIAGRAGITSSLVRQDLMRVGYCGNPQHGYAVGGLDAALAEVLGGRGPARAVLLGVGNLGRAILQHFRVAHPSLEIAAAFETDAELVATRCQGVQVHGLRDLESVVSRERAAIAILAVPGGEAQRLADRLVAAGVSSILNTTSTIVRAPAGTYVENHDIGLALTRAAYFAHANPEVQP